MLAILVGVILLGLSTWPGEQNASGGATADLGSAQYALIAHIIGGGSALLAVLIAQWRKQRGLPRVLLIVGALALLSAFVVALLGGTAGPRAWLTLAVPAVLLVVASFGVGPMPRHVTDDAPSDAADAPSDLQPPMGRRATDRR